jgi:hypothetical protein
MSRCSGGTNWKNGCRAQDWMCLTKIRKVSVPLTVAAVPVTQCRDAVVMAGRS